MLLTGEHGARARTVLPWLLAAVALGGIAEPGAGQMDHHDHGAAGFDSGDMTMGVTWSTTFDTEGSYEYHCHPHPYMTGRVTVTDSDAAQSGPVAVRIENYSFEPAILVVKPGAKVAWTNLDNTTHTVTQVHEDVAPSRAGIPAWQWGLAVVATGGAAALFLVNRRHHK